ncbi:hypothetical protein FA13DRAFT_1797329 [Coprinellus micaceus]|uniref:Uncharacterized protein n=1 Tax=Coprinellus micaceus TaxID=71717 RepID=A0A4Y7SP70_COPMI|nr:hypothetical protein FA13DRAFT_1797895 [Coprinellus micaceus]TEB24277.1 hypothetical protein FA13DRAFT_1797329 [Coprinellus micaceus]
MVAITLPKFALLATAMVGPLTTVVSARGSYYSGDSLAARAYLDDDIDLVGRGFYDDEPLSVREYIDEQIEVAVRTYAEEFEEIYARHSKEKIAEQIKYWKEQLKISQDLLKPLVKAKRDAEKAYEKDKSEANKQKKKAADLAEWKQREIVEGNKEQLEYWQNEKPSRAGTPEKAPPKKRPGMK